MRIIKWYCIVLFITKNNSVHGFNICTRNIIQIENHEYFYQIINLVHLTSFLMIYTFITLSLIINELEANEV